jgi:hypothetical protein
MRAIIAWYCEAILIRWDELLMPLGMMAFTPLGMVDSDLIPIPAFCRPAASSPTPNIEQKL